MFFKTEVDFLSFFCCPEVEVKPPLAEVEEPPEVPEYEDELVVSVNWDEPGVAPGDGAPENVEIGEGFKDDEREEGSFLDGSFLGLATAPPPTP